MSGHSKWATIKRAKAVTDKKKGMAFTKLAKNITIAAKAGGGDPNSNFKLRLAIEKARGANMPKDNVERAIKRGTGELEGATLEELTYEGFGPGGAAVIIETLTDSRNRTINDLKNIMTKHGGNIGTPNSVAWMFERKGVLSIPVAGADQKTKEDLEMKIIEAGAQDLKEDGDHIYVYTAPADLQKVNEALEKQGNKIENADLEFVAKETLKIDDAAKEKLTGLFEALDENDDVQNFFTNAEL